MKHYYIDLTRTQAAGETTSCIYGKVTEGEREYVGFLGWTTFRYSEGLSLDEYVGYFMKIKNNEHYILSKHGSSPKKTQKRF